MPTQHNFGMRSSHGGIEDRAQERASVGHRSRCFQTAEWMSVIYPIVAKENPRETHLAGVLDSLSIDGRD
jgi:hypothetical protein